MTRDRTARVGVAIAAPVSVRWSARVCSARPAWVVSAQIAAARGWVRSAHAALAHSSARMWPARSHLQTSVSSLSAIAASVSPRSCIRASADFGAAIRSDVEVVVSSSQDRHRTRPFRNRAGRLGDDARRARAGVSRCACVQDAMALEHDDLAGSAARARRAQGRTADPAAGPCRRRSP